VAKALTDHSRLRSEVMRASAYVGAINWWSTFETDSGEGACIPIAVFTAAFLKAGGIAARPVEAGARFDDPLSVRYAEVGTLDGSSALEAEDKPGHPFIGHMVVHVPTHMVVLDLSLPTQSNVITLRNLGKVDVLVGHVNHRRGDVGFKTDYGRGTAAYRIYPKRDGWKHRAWPWRAMIGAGERAYRGEGEFAEVATEYEVEEL
jgi:hypothetical protein